VLITLIHNPGAGDDDQPDGEALQSIIRAAGHEVRYQPCSDETWASILDEPADLVAVAGGDGTVGRVAKKLIGRDIPVAPLPLGTANNISKTLGLTELPLVEIVAGWKNARHVSFDAGIAKGPWGSRYFMEAFGVGLFACTMPAADESRKLKKLKDADAKVAHAIGMLRQRLEGCPSNALDLVLDGRDAAGDYVLLEAMNMAFVGPNLYLAPDLDPDDGMLDVVVVTGEERDKLHDSLATWQEGELEHPRLTRHLARRIQFEWTGFEVHFDDESWPTGDDEKPPALTHIEVTVEHDALKFVAPGAGARHS
jgi:diacylglycerol kinase family enzyme